MSRSAKLGARLLGVGLTTAVAVGLTAAPASARPDVTPVFIEGTPPLECPNGATGATFAAVDTDHEIELPGGPAGVLSVNISDDGTQLTFAIAPGGDISVRTVTVANESNAFRYSYDAATGFPNGTTLDDDLVAPPTADGYLPIDHINFCIIPSPYNGNGNGHHNGYGKGHDDDHGKIHDNDHGKGHDDDHGKGHGKGHDDDHGKIHGLDLGKHHGKIHGLDLGKHHGLDLGFIFGKGHGHNG
jgi:hypothetical protein